MNVRTATRRLLAALRTDGRAWESSSPDDECWIGLPDRVVIHVDAIKDGASVWFWDPDRRERKVRFAIHDSADLRSVLERVVGSARAWAARLTIHRLRSGAYRVRRSFQDYYAHSFAEGEVLHFVARKYLPYHGGNTIVFRERSLYLQDEDNGDVLHDFDLYFEKVRAPAGNGSARRREQRPEPRRRAPGRGARGGRGAG